MTKSSNPARQVRPRAASRGSSSLDEATAKEDQKSESRPVAGRLRQPTAQRRVDAVMAIIELARESGPEGITTQAIADHMGITHGALFRHFANKAEIWEAVFQWISAQLVAVADAVIADGGEPVEILERLFYAQVTFVGGHPGVPRILFHELQRPVHTPLHAAARSIVANYVERVRQLVARAKAKGQLGNDLDERAAAVLFVSCIQGLALQSALMPSVDALGHTAHDAFPILLCGFRGCRKSAGRDRGT